MDKTFNGKKTKGDEGGQQVGSADRDREDNVDLTYKLSAVIELAYRSLFLRPDRFPNRNNLKKKFDGITSYSKNKSKTLNKGSNVQVNSDESSSRDLATIECVFYIDHISWIINDERRENDMFLPSDLEISEIQDECKGLKNTSLKVLQLFPPWSAKVLETILQLASNLDEIDSDVFCFKEMCNINSMNRLHLLRNLSVTTFNLRKCEEILDLCKIAGVNLQLRNVRFSSLNYTYNFAHNSELKDRMLNVINIILENCWNSLEGISWDCLLFLPGIKFPKVMPKVWKFEFRVRSKMDLPRSKSDFLPYHNFRRPKTIL